VFEKAAFTTGGSISGGWAMYVYNGGNESLFRFTHATDTSVPIWNTPVGTVTLGTWHHVAVVYDKDSSANTPAIYLDGVAQTVTANPVAQGTLDADGANTLRMGNRANLDRSFDGSLDEARLSPLARDAGWIATTFSNQNDAATFCTVGPAL
jgi:hypothetical protein